MTIDTAQNGNAVAPAPARAFTLTSRDEQILSMTDEEYHLLSWDDLRDIIARNDLQALTRLPSQLKAYLQWSHDTKLAYGNMNNFLIQERIKWDPIWLNDGKTEFRFDVKNPTPFAHPSDYKILRNDWPYGLHKGITHICVWLKGRLPVDGKTGDLTSEGRKMVVDFVQKEFVVKLGLEGQDRVLWFKNWAGLQSVRGIEHIHVLTRDVDDSVLEKVLDQPVV